MNLANVRRLEIQPVKLRQRRKIFEKLNFCNIKDLQLLKLSTSKATSTTAQDDVHPDIA